MSVLTAEVPLHPEAVDDDPQVLRWVVPAGLLGFVGAPLVVPAALRALLSDGTLASVLVEAAAVRTALGTGRSWRLEGGRVREALQQALGDPHGWAPAGARSSDEVLAAAAQEVIDGDVGDYVRGHGGDVALVSATGGRVTVRLSGACTHCPASDLTLTERFETAVRARCPSLVSVQAVSAAGPGGSGGVAGGRRLLGLRPLRRD